MDYAVLKKIAEYSDVYEVAALGISSVEEMKAALKKKGATGGTFQRRTEYLTGKPAYISINVSPQSQVPSNTTTLMR